MDVGPDPGRAALRESAAIVGALALTASLAAGCVLAPLSIAVHVSPWLGMVTAVGAAGIWARFGPRPFPGLLPGVMCLAGFAAILGALLACVGLAVRG